MTRPCPTSRRLDGPDAAVLACLAVIACGTKIDPVQVLDVPHPAGGLTWCADVEPVFARRCTSCHAIAVQGPARAGAPSGVNLDTYAGASANARRSVVRMQAGSMPPGGGVPGSEVATVIGWVDGGMTECGSPLDDTGMPDGATLDTGLSDPGPLDAPNPGGVTWCGRIQGLLAANCTSCHASTNTGSARGGAPVGMDFDTYALAVANAASANASIQAGRMPLSGPLSPPDRADFQAWVDHGEPQCGGADDLPQDIVAIDPGPPVPTCTSGNHWTGGTDVSDAERLRMYPGRNCITCHGQSGEDAPIFTTAGTVMGGLRDEDDCYGVSGVTVEITDNNTRITTLVSNTTGNFMLPGGSIVPPYSVRVTKSGRERKMAGKQTDLNCMNCHTWVGANQAPGRILAP